MKNLFEAGKLLLLDMASTFFFLVLYLLTHNITLSVALGMALGIGQIGWQYARKAPIDTMQWMSLFLVLGSGAATLITNDPRFVMVKPSVIYTVVGIVMLKPGWMNRYLPPGGHRARAGHRLYRRLRLGGTDVLLRRIEPVRGLQLQRGGMVGVHVDLGHRQLGRAVPDRLCHHAHDRRAPPPRPDGGCRFLTHSRNHSSRAPVRIGPMRCPRSTAAIRKCGLPIRTSVWKLPTEEHAGMMAIISLA